MFTYKRTIICPHSVEVEVYNSIRKVGKQYGGRSVNRSLSPARQKAANQIRTTRKWERIIDCNFCEDDFFCRFSAPFGTFCDEESFMREVRNFFERIKRQCKKRGLVFKYIGFRECGKLGKNWHMHIILSAEVAKIAKSTWHYKNGGINFSPLWDNHSYEKLASYIRKDITDSDSEQYPAKKRMMASRNLERPEVKVKPCSRREIRRLEKGKEPEPPKGFSLVRDESVCTVNDWTGANYYFKFRRLDAFRGGQK